MPHFPPISLARKMQLVETCFINTRDVPDAACFIPDATPLMSVQNSAQLQMKQCSARDTGKSSAKKWIHDNNTSVNNEIKRRGIISANDLWHGIKNLKRVVKNVTCGPKKWANETQNTWDEDLPYVLDAYRASPQASSGSSPFYLLYD